MRSLLSSLIFLTFSLFLSSCGEEGPERDTLSKGTIDISVDESYRSVIEQESKVFDSSFPNAKVNVHYKPEAECFKDYFDNKARIILVTRELTPEEKEMAKQKQFFASSVALAKDAIVVVTNKSNSDTVFGPFALQGILSDSYKKKYTVVVDNQNSSLFRVLSDSLMKGKTMGKNIYAAKNGQGVIDYVSKNPDAIGFASLCDVVDPNDSANLGNFINNVNICAIHNDELKESFKPYMAYLGLKQYPLARKLYYVSRESYAGLGTGYANFLGGPRGQLIFAHAHLLPLRMEITIRQAEINNKQ